MERTLGIGLLVLGAGAAIALAAPSLVLIGLFLGIVPGLVLGAMPTLFLWFATFTALWWLWRSAIAPWPAALAAALSTAALLFTVSAISARLSDVAMRQALGGQADIAPPQPIRIAGDVLITVPRLDVMPHAGPKPLSREAQRARPWVCDALCAALLATPGVTSVTVDAHGDADQPGAPSPRARTLRLVPKRDCGGETIRPLNPASLDIDRPRDAAALDHRLREAEWDLRLSAESCIVAEPARPEHALRIAILAYVMDRGERVRHPGGNRWSPLPLPVSVDRLEIRDRDGTVLLSQTLAKTQALSVPLHIVPDGGLDNFRFRWSRSPLSNAARYAQWRPAALIARHTTLDTGGDRAALTEAIRRRLGELLDDPAIPASDPGFRLIGAWLARFSPAVPPSDADQAFIRRLIGEPRLTDYGQLGTALRALGLGSLAFRDAIGRRLAATDPPARWMRFLAQQYEPMPAGAFVQTTADEDAILADPARRLHAAGLIVRLADKGEAAVPLLVEILRVHAQRLGAPRRGADASEEMPPIDAVRRALCLLGPAAAQALPEIEDMRRSGLLRANLVERREWSFLLARLGKPVEDIPKPANLSGTADQFHARLRERLERFEPRRSCGAGW